MENLKIDKNTWIISDTHFEHDNINKYETIRLKTADENGFSSVDEMMFYRWNNTILPNDNVIHLGDFAMKKLPECVADLHGKITLIKGNHDGRKKMCLPLENTHGWSICNYLHIDESIPMNKREKKLINTINTELSSEMPLICGIVFEIDNKRILLSHFPVFDDNVYNTKYLNEKIWLEKVYEEFNCVLNIHGHTHSHGSKQDFCKSACVEKNEFLPKKLGSFLTL